MTPTPALRTLVLAMATMMCRACTDCRGSGIRVYIRMLGDIPDRVDEPCLVCGDVRAAIRAVEQEKDGPADG